MKLHPILTTLIAAATLSLPMTADAKDKHDRGNRDRGHDRDHRHHSYRSYPSYRAPYFGYGYGYRPYYYHRPSIGISFYRAPSTVYRGTRVGDAYSHSLAASVQRELRRLGYYRGSVDGDIGPGSRSAIATYQRSHRLAVTGRIDSALLRSLGIRS